VQLDFSFYLHNLVIENKFDFTKNKLINQILAAGYWSLVAGNFEFFIPPHSTNYLPFSFHCCHNT